MGNNEEKAARDKLWQATFETYYDSYWQELSANRLLERWSASMT